MFPNFPECVVPWKTLAKEWNLIKFILMSYINFWSQTCSYMVRSTLLQCVSSTGLWLLWGHLLKCVSSTPKLDVLNDLKSSPVVFALSSQYYLLIQSIRRYVTEFRSDALAEHVVPIDVRLERKIAKNCAKSFWCNISYDA